MTNYPEQYFLEQRRIAGNLQHLSLNEKYLLVKASNLADQELRNDNDEITLMNRRHSLGVGLEQIVNQLKARKIIHPTTRGKLGDLIQPTTRGKLGGEEDAVVKWIKHVRHLFDQSSRTLQAYEWIRESVGRLTAKGWLGTWYIKDSFANVEVGGKFLKRHVAGEPQPLSAAEKELLVKASDLAQKELEDEMGEYDENQRALATRLAELHRDINRFNKIHSHSPGRDERETLSTWLQRFSRRAFVSHHLLLFRSGCKGIELPSINGQQVTKGFFSKWSIDDKFTQARVGETLLKNESDFLKAELVEGFRTLVLWIESVQSPARNKCQHHINELQRFLLPQNSTPDRTEWLKVSHVIRTLKYLAYGQPFFDQAGNVTPPFRKETVLKIKQFWKPNSDVLKAWTTARSLDKFRPVERTVPLARF
ncbi:hypothetical protein JCM16303_003086 [Sporobolomyces ruberrimus]